MSSVRKPPKGGKLCSSGCGRAAFVIIGLERLCREAMLGAKGMECKGMCRYECVACQHVWTCPHNLPEWQGHACPKCNHPGRHKLLGRAPESEQVYG